MEIWRNTCEKFVKYMRNFSRKFGKNLENFY